MFERFISILPVILLALAAGTVIIWWSNKQPKTSQNLEERLKNIQSELSKFGLVAIFVAPCFEEVIFRAPLIVGFASPTATAWLMLCHVGLLFGYMHVTAMHARLYQDLPSSMRSLFLNRLLHIGSATVIGVVLGYLAIQFQSLLLVIVLHMAWNSQAALRLRRHALRKVRENEAMGGSVEQLTLGRSFSLHLQESTKQIPYSSVFFEKGWSTAPKVGDTFKLMLENREVPHKIYKIRASATEAHVFALPIER